MGLLDTPMNYDQGGLYLPRTVRSRAEGPVRSRVLFQEDGTAWPPGMWNDGVGDAYNDYDIMLGGKPTYRLQTQGNVNTSATSPGRTAATGGVVFKRRIHDSFSGFFAMDLWFRFTSTANNGAGNPLLSMSIYNRTGTDTDGDSTAWHGRMWLDQKGNNVDMRAAILDGAATAAGNGNSLVPTAACVYTTVATSGMQNGAGTHNWDPSASSGRLDRAGGWHYAYMAIDLNAKKYVGMKLDSQAYVDLSSYTLDHTTSTGFAGMHFSVEYSATTSTDRFCNVAQVTGYGK